MRFVATLAAFPLRQPFQFVNFTMSTLQHVTNNSIEANNEIIYNTDQTHAVYAENRIN